jgi:alkanesulfonate monooxygenase SsuD/methylene tetrahydromethanopterin reductase-like flavin-dependent oxidoreductase (luciferase family)
VGTVTAIGIHLPQLVARPTAAAAAEAVECAVAAERLGFAAVSVNDHVTYHGPWLDGPTLLAAAAARTARIGLATTVLLPALRGAPVAAQTLTALRLLSGDRLIAGVGVGSHAEDHALCGVPFERRGAALDEAIAELRRRCPDGPPIWVASWGRALRRVARLGDGWVASALVNDAQEFGTQWQRLRQFLTDEGRDADDFPNILATLFYYVGDDAERVVSERLAPLLGKPPETVLARSAVGSPAAVRERIAAYAAAGAQRIHLWPAADPLEQLEALADATAVGMVPTGARPAPNP